jgi:hypothetical protein
LAILLTPFDGTALPYRGKLDIHDDIRVSYANQIMLFPVDRFTSTRTTSPESPSMVPAGPVNEPGGRTQHRFGIGCQLVRVATGEVDS